MASHTSPSSAGIELVPQQHDQPDEIETGGRSEVLGIVFIALSCLFFLALASYDSGGGRDWVGPVGSALAAGLAGALGILAWWVPVELASVAIRIFRRVRPAYGLARAFSTIVVISSGSTLIHLAATEASTFGAHMPGGLLGEVTAELLRASLGTAGAAIISVSTLLVTMVLRTDWSVVRTSRRVIGIALGASEASKRGAMSLFDAWKEAKRLEREEEEARRLVEQPRVVVARTLSGTTLIDATSGGTEDAPAKRSKRKQKEEPLPADPVVEAELSELFPEEEARKAALEADDDEPESIDTSLDATSLAEAAGSSRKKKKDLSPVIVTPESLRIAAAKKDALSPRSAEKPAEKPKKLTSAGPFIPFVLPPSTLLDPPLATEIRIDAAALRENATRLVEKLKAYGVEGRVDEIHPGPVVTMYELEPASGTKLAKIASLSDDLAMALAADKVRIVAPIPGKARVGFELPNKHRQIVYLRDIIEHDGWRTTTAALPMAIGKDIAGQPVYVDLSRMPHLLVAGATGTGKSVGLNVMLASLLTKCSPEELRLLMIDPKVVELRVFDGIPHMLLPVVTDMQKASLALRWAVDEMERRYQLFADAGARNITTYNERVEKVLRGELAPEKLTPSRAKKVRAFDENGQEVYLPPVDDEAPSELPMPKKLPYVVVVVDEFADLMMTAAKDVEAAIARLAQKARAAGIHVILATQRPSVDVITGMIKANFPARIGFKVSQREDSKTILGRSGAEHLLGMGDMLMIPPGASELRRVHGAYISEDEVARVCDFLRAQGRPEYDETILKPRDEDSSESGAGGGAASDDPLYDRAVALVLAAGYCSISHIQRHLSVGYNKAAKLVEQMEKEGVVGPPSSKAGGRREVLAGRL